jgi:outer membrane cobalamin receptor
MKATNNDKLRLSILAALSLTTTAPALAQQVAGAADAAPNTAGAQDATAAQGATQPPPATASNNESAAAPDNETGLDTIVVTGTTSQRTLLNASVDVTVVTPTDLEQKAPRTTADVLQL